MQQSRGGRRKDAECPQGDQRAVEAHDKAVIPVDASHELLGELPQQHQLPQILRRDGDIRHLPGDAGPAADGHANVRQRQGGRVVDAVADHDDLASRLLFGADKGRLVLGQHLSAIVVNVQFLCNGSRRAAVVPGEHDDLLDPGTVEEAYDLLCLRAQRVIDADGRGEPPADGQVQPGAIRLQGVKRRLILGQNLHALVLKDKVAAADDSPLAPDLGGDAVGHHVFHFAVHLPVVQAPLPGGAHHGVCHRVGEMLLQAGGHAQHFPLILSPEGYDLPHRGAGVGEGAGLVKDHGVRAAQNLHVLAALDRDLVVAGLPHGREDAQGHGELQGAGKIHHQH